MVMWTVLTWILVPIMAVKYGINGAGAAYGLVGISSIIVIYVAKRYVNFSVVTSIVKPFMASLIMGAILLGARSLLPTKLFSVWVLMAVGLVFYTLISYLIIGQKFVRDVEKSVKRLVKKG